MAKFYGMIGYGDAQEDPLRPGIWTDIITERPYYGDVIRNSRRTQGSDVLEDISITNEFSIISDPFANENFHSIKYIVYMGTRWKVTNVTVQYPRLILSAGGVYNGPS